MTNWPIISFSLDRVWLHVKLNYCCLFCILPKELVGILTWHPRQCHHDLVKKILHFVVSIKATETAKQGTLLSKKKYIYIYIRIYISKYTQWAHFKCYWTCFSKKKKMLLNLLPRPFGQFRLKSMTLIMRKIKIKKK